MVSIDTARQILKDLFNFDAELNPLYGELDDNFLATAGSGEKSILKIMHDDCKEQRVDLQCQAIAHLDSISNQLNLPRVITTEAGQPYSIVSVDGVYRLVWLLRYCPGTLLAEFTPHTDVMIRSFGHTIGLIDVRLKSFTHSAMRQGHQWELTRATASRSLVKNLTGNVARQVDSVLQHFENITAKKLEHLRHSVIHNDANDYNVLVNFSKNGDAIVDGLFDFGDITYQPTICEVAIALAYLVLNKDDPFTVCARFLEGYNEINPLRGDELSVLYDLIMTRISVSIAIASARRRNNPSALYNNSSIDPAVDALSLLANQSPRMAECLFRQTCSLDT
jgi:Ser/Thr protein kinase RdoA (MazF antagonist)